MAEARPGYKRFTTAPAQQEQPGRLVCGWRRPARACGCLARAQYLACAPPHQSPVPHQQSTMALCSSTGENSSVSTNYHLSIAPDDSHVACATLARHRSNTSSSTFCASHIRLSWGIQRCRRHSCGRGMARQSQHLRPLPAVLGARGKRLQVN